jgi:ribonuclease D
MESPEFKIIAEQEGLAEAISALEGLTEAALDTEADNLHHYETRVCLLQLNAGGRIFLIDALASIDLRPLWKALEGKLLLMHGSDFDLRLLAELGGFRPRAIFDTMLASQLLGLPRIGLASLLEEFFSVHLPKDSQKSDWSRRPLPEKMVNYAAKDVYYLPELRDILAGRLEELGRLDWLRQKCDWQIEVGATGFPKPDENAWRIGKSEKLSQKALAALYELWHWRDSEARRLDLPHFKVMSNEYLLRLAEAVAAGQAAAAFESLPPGMRRKRTNGLVDALNRGTERDPSTLPRRRFSGEGRQPLNFEELQRQELLKNHRDRIAAELKIDSTLIATRAQLAQIARIPEDYIQGLLPWQAELLRPAVEECLARARP